MVVLEINATEQDRMALSQVFQHLEDVGFVLGPASAATKNQDQVAADAPVDPGPLVVLTVWSEGSLLDENVVGKAAAALRDNRLFPVRIEDVDLPLGFRQMQCFDLVHFSEETAEDLAKHLRLRLDPPTDPTVFSQDFQKFLVVADWFAFVGLFGLIYFSVAIWFPDFRALMMTRNWVRLFFVLPPYATFLNAWFLGCPAIVSGSDSQEVVTKLSRQSAVDLLLQIGPLLLVALIVVVEMQDEAFMDTANIYGYHLPKLIALPIAGLLFIWKPGCYAICAVGGRYLILRFYAFYHLRPQQRR